MAKGQIYTISRQYTTRSGLNNINSSYLFSSSRMYNYSLLCNAVQPPPIATAKSSVPIFKSITDIAEDSSINYWSERKWRPWTVTIRAILNITSRVHQLFSSPKMVKFFSASRRRHREPRLLDDNHPTRVALYLWKYNNVEGGKEDGLHRIGVLHTNTCARRLYIFSAHERESHDKLEKITNRTLSPSSVKPQLNYKPPAIPSSGAAATM